MNKKTIEKTIDIHAPKERVWQVLQADELTRLWYAIFSEGTHAETDWKQGSRVVFRDASNSGMLGRIAESRPNEFLAIEYDGMVGEDGKEDYDSAMANEMKGGRETYQLSATGDHTNLAVSCDMSEQWYEPMSAAWDKAMVKIKELSEQ
jgi:uncharacterized protein YndB with AHSA1/START domain